MNKIKYFFNNFEFIIGMLLSMVMVSVLFIQVVSRYVFNYSLAFSEELAIIMFILSVYFGAIGAVRRDQHLRIELLASKVSPKTRILMRIIADSAFIVANVFIMYGIILVTANLRAFGMTTAILGIQKWMCYAVLPFSFFVMSLRLGQGIYHRIKELMHFGSDASGVVK